MISDMLGPCLVLNLKSFPIPSPTKLSLSIVLQKELLVHASLLLMISDMLGPCLVLNVKSFPIPTPTKLSLRYCVTGKVSCVTAVGHNLICSSIVFYLYLFCCLSRSSLHLYTFVFCSSYGLDNSGVTKITDEGDLYRASCLSSMHRTRHLGFSSSTRSHRYFTLRISYTPNSVSTFNLTRLRLTTSGDISPNPGPPITSFTTNSRAVQHRSHYHSDCSKLVQISCVSDLHLRTSATHLTVCTLNARSIANKSALFVHYINDCKADLCAITETWLADQDPAVCNETTPPSYKLFHCPRSDRRGGGTALLFRDNINVCKLESGSRNSFEFSEYLVCTGSLRI